MFRVLAATAAFAVVHSVLASRAAKRAASRIAGERARDGWYRVAFNAQAVATFGALAAYARGLPDRTLYEVRGPLALLMRAGQLAGLAWAAWAVREVGLTRISGAASVLAWASGRDDVPAEPEAQGPAPAAAASGVEPGRAPLRVSGPFALSRHPLNFSPLPVLWLQPRMTANLAAFNALATAYLVVGSLHEESRLAAEYGEEYEAYRRSGVRFLVPGLRAVGPRA